MSNGLTKRPNKHKVLERVFVLRTFTLSRAYDDPPRYLRSFQDEITRCCARLRIRKPAIYLFTKTAPTSDVKNWLRVSKCLNELSGISFRISWSLLLHLMEYNFALVPGSSLPDAISRLIAPNRR
jgi:hypothetical protein